MFPILAISLLLGGLVGLQRQHVDSPLGGVRTFPLVTVFGSLCAMLVMFAVVLRTLLPEVAPVLIGLMIVSLQFALLFSRRAGQSSETMPPPGNPSEVKSAIMFGVLYGVVLVAVAVAKKHLPDTGLFAIAALSNLVFNSALVLAVEDRKLFRDVAWLLGISCLLGVSVLWW